MHLLTGLEVEHAAVHALISKADFNAEAVHMPLSQSAQEAGQVKGCTLVLVETRKKAKKSLCC